jgi:hypothetical protein
MIVMSAQTPRCGQQTRHSFSRRLTQNQHATSTFTAIAKKQITRISTRNNSSAARTPCRAMVNVDVSPSVILGVGLIGSGVSLWQIRQTKPWISKDYDVVISCISLLVGGILIFQGWRLDPLLLFGQLMTTGAALSFAVEALRLRNEVYEQDEAKALMREYRDFPMNDRDSGDYSGSRPLIGGGVRDEYEYEYYDDDDDEYYSSSASPSSSYDISYDISYDNNNNKNDTYGFESIGRSSAEASESPSGFSNGRASRGTGTGLFSTKPLLDVDDDDDSLIF